MAWVTLVAAVVAAACTPAARVLTGEQTGRGQVFTVVVDDRTGWIQGFEFVRAEVDPGTGLDVSNPDGEPAVLRVRWVGGGCELTATLAVSRTTDGLHVLVTERPACLEQMGVFRVIDLVFDREVPAESVDADLVVP